MIPDLSTFELRAIRAVEAHRSFRAAAEFLELPPSSLSYVVRSIEQRLGIRIFNRTTRSVSATDAGRRFLLRVSPALDAIDAAVDEARDLRDQPAGLLRINAAEPGAEQIMPSVVSYMAAFPDVQIDIRLDGGLVDIVRDGFDAGIRLAEAVPQDMVAVPISGDEAMIVVAAPCYVVRRGAPGSPSDLSSHTCIRARFPSGTLMRWEFERDGQELRLDVDGGLSVGSPWLAAVAASNGAGIAFVHQRSVAAMIRAGTLVQLLEEWTPPFPGLCLYYPRQRLPSAALRTFIDHVRANRAPAGGQADFEDGLPAGS
ncbi:LysR family transcriptional regulator [Sphingomonas sp. BK235]|uniref:LysR family transcriptional regulator n=1 Tax=Sphingomonas sp. BK235 TaxID=2512131 RepID=UPI001052AFF1|nr:LysR family transcriptional regulator [Sphingomonas sp. BK235]TCP36038.1 DNA-binding transcriptional LysR family regulator [Sphingomonas sp. BK235]